ncbi:hypothetical protein [Paraburkholderia tropica]|uniref:hypothetical protein n=1 Tax=Paraburkholderia tropica TaxID=92647 RepID=UPI0031D8DB36
MTEIPLKSTTRVNTNRAKWASRRRLVSTVIVREVYDEHLNDFRTYAEFSLGAEGAAPAGKKTGKADGSAKPRRVRMADYLGAALLAFREQPMKNRARAVQRYQELAAIQPDNAVPVPATALNEAPGEQQAPHVEHDGPSFDFDGLAAMNNEVTS